MTDQPASQPENPETEQEEKLSAEQKAAQQQQQALSRETPETKQASLVAQALEALSLLGYQQFNNRRNALAAVSDPKLAENLLDLAHPEKCAAVRDSLRITDRELKKKGVGERGFAQARFLFWKSPKLTPEQQQRAIYATVLARRLHRKVTARENELKIQAYYSRYSVDPANLPQFNTNISQWLKNNPGRSLDDALIVETARIRREQGGKLSGKEKEELRNDLAGCNGKAVEEFEKNGTLGRAKEVEKQILDPNQPLPSRDLIRNSESYIYEGIIPQKSPITEAALSGGFAEIPMGFADDIMGYPPSPAPAPTGVASTINQIVFQPVGQPAISVGVAAPPPTGGAAVPNVFSRAFSGLGEKLHLPAGLNNFLGGVGKRLGGVLNRANLALEAGKTLLNTGLNALLPGLGTAVGKINSALKTITGVDVEAAVVKLVVLVIVVIPIALMFLPLLLNSSNALPYYGTENAKVVTLSQDNKTGWYDFEEKFLTLVKQETNDQKLKSVSWEQFEKESLLFLSKQISNNQISNY